MRVLNPVMNTQPDNLKIGLSMSRKMNDNHEFWNFINNIHNLLRLSNFDKLLFQQFIEFL